MSISGQVTIGGKGKEGILETQVSLSTQSASISSLEERVSSLLELYQAPINLITPDFSHLTVEEITIAIEDVDGSIPFDLHENIILCLAYRLHHKKGNERFVLHAELHQHFQSKKVYLFNQKDMDRLFSGKTDLRNTHRDLLDELNDVNKAHEMSGLSPQDLDPAFATSPANVLRVLTDDKGEPIKKAKGAVIKQLSMDDIVRHGELQRLLMRLPNLSIPELRSSLHPVLESLA